MASVSRREFVGGALAAAVVGAGSRGFQAATCLAAPVPVLTTPKMQFGLVTYMWGAKWDLPTLLANCEKAKSYGVELRTEHAHHVEPNLSAAERSEVKKKFSGSPVKLIGLGTNEAFHSPDPAVVKKAIERAKEFIKLSHDIGGSGVKVKPNDLPADVPKEKTIEQIGKSLNELGKYAAGLGQQVRLEVHGQCAPLPIIAAIMAVADNPSVAVCWNSNRDDLKGDGLEKNFQLVEKRLGATTHVHELDSKKYPYTELFKLLKGIDYNGWVLLEASDKRDDYAAALAEQREIFDKLVRGKDSTG